MRKNSLDSERMPLYLAISILFLLAARVIYFYFSQQEDLIGIIPDDAFYYIKIASHRAKDGVWTFDGTTPATGFHFLYGYFLVFIFKLFAEISWTGIYLIVGTISCLTISASVYFLTKTVVDIYGKRVALATVLPFLSFFIIIQSTGMMESWLVILFSSITIFCVAKREESSARMMLGLFLIGFLGSLSRTDYGMLPGVLFCTIFLVDKFKITQAVCRSFVILSGALLGVCLVLLQNYFISGQLAQASAQTKLFWSSVAGHNIYVPLNFVLLMTFPSINFLGENDVILIFTIIFLAVAYSLLKSLKLFRMGNQSTPTTLLIGCALTVIGYIFFYRHNSAALQSWYSSNFVAPIAIVIAANFHYLLGKRALIPVVLVFVVYFFFGIKVIFSIPWPHQAGMMNAGLYIRALEGGSNFSAWNAGILSYFSEKPLINIDGLTNDEVLPYIKSNKLMDYLKSKNINYIVDYKEMIDNKQIRLRGGYDDERVFRCLTPIKPIDGNGSSWNGSRLFLFKVDTDCL